MTINDIVQALSSDSLKFPRAALSAARHNWKELLPEIHHLFDVALGETQLSVDQENFLFWGILLLADQNETDSFEKLVSLCIHEGEKDTLLDRVLDDVITETLPTILYTLCNGRSDSLSLLISSRCADEFIKVGAMRVLYRLYCDGSITREFFCNHAPLWLSSLASYEQRYALGVLGCFLIELKLNSFQPEMLKFRKEGLIDEGILLPKEVETWTLGDVEYGTKDVENIHSSFDVMSVEGWGGFEPHWAIERPYIATTLPKRNDPCFCGSGKKYKKCCLR